MSTAWPEPVEKVARFLREATGRVPRRGVLCGHPDRG